MADPGGTIGGEAERPAAGSEAGATPGDETVRTPGDGSDESTLLAAGERSRQRAGSPSVAGYRLLQPIGAGGMGQVFEAEQQRPVRRRVALKVIKRGMDTDEVVARFESERQALALMSHPNIAAVYDGGATEEGRPFFAMELVHGEPITEYCDRHRLGVRERLNLFLEVCEGVQHAHQKGIIHRDLKPSNVLVSVGEGRPSPKIIDFGVAKATSQRLTERSMHTSLGTLIGTPEYMSPEQAEMSGLDIDTRTDIYSLGVILYELLAGVLPFDLSGPRRAGLATMQRVIREEEPRPPSARVTALGAAGRSVPGARRTDSGRLVRSLRGDLDWIILKALEKDRTRRYETADALAMDIRRHLADEPVLAGPPSVTYRMRKFVRRHRGAVIAAALVVAALVAGLVGTALALSRAVEAERRASREAAAAREVSEFLVDLFRSAEPGAAAGGSVTAREILERGAERVERELGRQPEIRARMLESIGTVYRHLGLYDDSRPLLEKSLEARLELFGPESLEVAASSQQLAELFLLQGSYRDARAHAENALEARERALGRDHPLVADSLGALGRSLDRQALHDEAEPLLRRVLEIREGAFGEESPEVADAASDLGTVLWRQGRLDEARPLLARALDAYERSVGPGDFRTRRTLNDLAVVEWSRGDLERAEELFERSLEIKERFSGPDHPEVATTLNNLALVHDAQGRPERAEELLERALSIYRARLGPEHDKTAMAAGNLAWVLYRQGRLDEAAPLYEEALAVYRRTVGPNHPSTAILLRDQAKLLAAQGRAAEAERQLGRSLAAWEATVGGDHPETATTLQALADLLAGAGRGAEAEALYRRALEIRRTRLGDGHAAVAESRRSLGELLRAGGRGEEAENLRADGSLP